MVRRANSQKCVKSPEQTLDKVPQPLGWAGGKMKLVPKLIEKVPPHQTYVEPFAGGGALFFAKKPAKKNVLNDIDSGLMQFYGELKNVKNLRCDMTPNRERFNRVRAKGDKGVCDFLYLNKIGYGSKSISHASYNPEKEKHCGDKCRIQKLTKDFGKTKERLGHAKLSSTDFRNTLKKYDSPQTFIYADPPYHKTSCHHQSCDLTPKEVAEAVKPLKAKVLVSYNDHPDVRKAFRGFKQDKVTTYYTMSDKNPNIVSKQLLIRNYDVKKCPK